MTDTPTPGEGWYWDERWQLGEREADAEVAAGLGTTHDNVGDLMSGLSSADRVQQQFDESGLAGRLEAEAHQGWVRRERLSGPDAGE